MERPVTVFTGAPEHTAICTIGSINEHVETFIPVDRYINKSNMRCISASSPEFAGYMSMSWEDAQVIFSYIETLSNSCVKWKKQ